MIEYIFCSLVVFLLKALCTYCITLIVVESTLFTPFRLRFKRYPFIYKLLSCFLCFSVWVSVWMVITTGFMTPYIFDYTAKVLHVDMTVTDGEWYLVMLRGGLHVILTMHNLAILLLYILVDAMIIAALTWWLHLYELKLLSKHA